MLRYHGPLYRPPSEASSLIVQATIGCSHNRCTFCSMYRSKRFRVVPPEEVQGFLDAARARLGDDVRRVFLADGDAMCLSSARLQQVLDRLAATFPKLSRVGIYANARDVLSKTDQELRELRQRKLGIVYLGLESGDEATLAEVCKGARVDDIVEAVRRARAAGMRVSVMVLVGLAGARRSLEHARASADAVSRMTPDYTALLTAIPTPGSELSEAAERGAFVPLSALESVREIREFLLHVRAPTYFTCNHASNYLPLTGVLPEDQDELLGLLDAALAGAVRLKPETMRGL